MTITPHSAKYDHCPICGSAERLTMYWTVRWHNGERICIPCLHWLKFLLGEP